MIRTTRTATISGAAALAVAAAIALTSCQSDPEASPTPTPSPTATTTSPSPSPTEASKSPEDVAADAAVKVTRDFYAMADGSLQNPSTFNPDDFKKVAISSALTDLQNSLNFTLSNGQHQIGSTEVTEITRTSVDLNPSDEIPIVELRVCWDVSDLNVVDKDGKSVVPADRAPLGVERVGVANYDYPDGPWQVAFTVHGQFAVPTGGQFRVPALRCS